MARREPADVAALSAFQEWSGAAIHTYRYRNNDPMGRMGGVVMYGVGYRVNFDTFNDPAKFGCSTMPRCSSAKGTWRLRGAAWAWH